MTGIAHKKDIIAFIYVTILTIVAVVYGFYIIPSPTKEQQITADHKRVIDLGSIQTTIDDYYQNNGQLPQSLNDLTYNANDSATSLSKVDPQTQQTYEYFILSSTQYQLCATFSTDSAKDDPNGYDDSNGDYASFSSQFTHPEGHHCFDEFETQNDNTTPSDYPSGYPEPTRFPCKAGEMCPMMNAQPSPAIYNQSNNLVTPTPAPVGGSGSYAQ